MDTNLITISLEDDSPGYKISPARVPLATLAAFAGEVRDFLKGTGKDGDADAAEVAVVSGSLSVEARYSSPSLARDLQILSATFNTDGIDPKRRAILQRWQSAAQKRGALTVSIKTQEGVLIAISSQTNFRAESERRLVNVERYVRGEMVDLGGATQANAHIKLPDGKTLVVRTDRDLIRSETENHVYKQVHLRIRAKLDLETGELTDAQLVEFVHYSPNFDQQAFDNLTVRGDEAWKDVDDPAEWVRKIRGATD
nr:hypothetical protein [uncultured Cupriavidus sp.]